MSQPTHIIVQTTTDSVEHANALAGKMIEARLAACVQVQPVTSHYRWEGTPRAEPEFLLSAKTRGALYPRLAEFIRANHGYQTPEILAVPLAGGSREYLEWIDRETRTPD